MSSTLARKKILSTGIGRPKNPEAEGFQYPEEMYAKMRALLETDIRKASELGYDIETLDLSPDPSELSHALEELREKVRGQEWDGFQIGFGVRGNKQFTRLFEGAVNVVREERPGVKMLFADAPDGIVEAIGRVFGTE